MICCSVKFLPPTTTVWAEAVPTPRARVAAARSPVSFIVNMENPSLLLLSSGTRRSPQRVYPSGDEPKLALPYEKIDNDGEDPGRDRSCEEHGRLHEIDAGEDEFAEPAAADQEGERHSADIDRQGRPESGEDDEQGVWQFDPEQNLGRGHPHAPGRLDQV